MDGYLFTPFPSSLKLEPSFLSERLPELQALFSLPPLEDRPQNPILETLLDRKALEEPKEFRLEIFPAAKEKELVNEEPLEDIWTDDQVISEEKPRKNQNLSWDALRQTFPKLPSSTPYLSEQRNDVFDSVRHHINPRLDDPSIHLRYILPVELLDQLMVNIVGNSSLLYIWDDTEQQLVPNSDENGRRLLVIIEGLDTTTSTGIIRRTLHIGTLLRRLENIAGKIRNRNDSPILHSLLHAISSVLTFLRNSLSQRPPNSTNHLANLSIHYSDTEELLEAVASLCHCDRNPPFEDVLSQPSKLLMHIYDHLKQHFERSSTKTVKAVLAYILQVTSQDYLATIGESLGLIDPEKAPWLRSHPQRNYSGRNAADLYALDDILVGQPQIIYNIEDDTDNQEFPGFFSKDLLEALPAAQKSLRILQAADPIFQSRSSNAIGKCRWVWSIEEVEAIWERGMSQQAPIVGHSSDSRAEPVSASEPTSIEREYVPELKGLKLFDMEPGTNSSDSDSNDSVQSLSSFISEFPERLPLLTPTLGHVVKLVLQPLAFRASTLSNAVLRLYLKTLNLDVHLQLLRSYMLITLPSFKGHLVQALFSDDIQIRADLPPGYRTHDTKEALSLATSLAEQTRYGVGLNPGLSKTGAWPPGGADLAFSLRTVIDDTLDDHFEENDPWYEGVSKLGFAIRDLPVGDGRESWLNPISIEALDFLYLDYKPAYPINIVLSPEILSKYQRAFTFILRVFRVETTLRLSYRCLFHSKIPLFPYSSQARSIAFNLRFQMQSFVMAFGNYVFDTIIAGNFDNYLQTISELRSALEEQEMLQNGIANIFELRASHSQLLDRILSGCLLRGVQRQAGDTLKNLFDTILSFGSLIENLYYGRIREGSAAVELSELNATYQSQMHRFILVVHTMASKEQGIDAMTPEDERILDHQRVKGSHLEDLLTRIDPMRLWRQKIMQTARRRT
ncbi:hypothetical protein M422DRAFT_224566 [Sphaerobolus stellatus SS14]|nr:hypothetical protein M422DRAFT_224566 [Sphaerobolus stellatus SS14]